MSKAKCFSRLSAPGYKPYVVTLGGPLQMQIVWERYVGFSTWWLILSETRGKRMYLIYSLLLCFACLDHQYFPKHPSSSAPHSVQHHTFKALGTIASTTNAAHPLRMLAHLSVSITLSSKPLGHHPKTILANHMQHNHKFEAIISIHGVVLANSRNAKLCCMIQWCMLEQ